MQPAIAHYLVSASIRDGFLLKLLVLKYFNIFYI